MKEEIKYYRKFLLVFGIYIISSQLIIAQNDAIKSNTTVLKTLGTDASNFLFDAYDVFTSPFNFQTREWTMTATILSSTVAVLPADESIKNFISHQHGGVQDVFMNFGTNYGRGLTALIISGGIYTTGFILGDDEIRNTGRMVIEAAFFSSMITGTLKMTFTRMRPLLNKGPYDFEFGFEKEDMENSLPSGHATAAFALSSVLARRIDKWWASIILYTAAGITSVSRVYHNVHWASDVLLGSAIGFVIGNAVVSVNEKRSSESNPKNLSFRLAPTFNGVGFILNF